MRAILVVLVVMNVLLLALHQLGVISSSGASRAGEAAVVPDSAPSLRLLSEVSDDLPPADRTPGGQGGGTVSDVLPLCALVGPFTERGDAQSIGERLRALDVSAETRDLEVSDGRGYWVHLAPELSQREALRRLHELQAKQIDSYVIPRGELANGISFGMFSRRALAEARRDELQALGYDAKIREVERTHREIWVVMPALQARALSDQLWEELLAESPALERRQNLCPGVASE
ncbi:SPOR domain-containing protein [Marinimicrobium sp. C6131]|uniref:SPOR domain-containing protein n=1 Tax=Marinimicrobium sp. C6131 TaxID=3022676 RepID=UPI00223D3A9F|nr:SPOR domain-containing protein [Marinimicrobium sp. C6131]UZJ44599.1 SPOR domain-containing protein [Marinimicrobium sp. C6131]